MITVTDVIFVALAVLTAAAAFIDLRTGQIPNRLVLLGLVLGSALHLVLPVFLRQNHEGSSSMILTRAGIDVFLGFFACSIAPLILFKLGAMGGGDVKLLAVIGATAGPLFGLQIEFCAFIVIALYAPARLAYEGQLLRMLGNTAALVANPFMPRDRRREVPQALLTSLPFGPALFVSTVLMGVAERWMS